MIVKCVFIKKISLNLIHYAKSLTYNYFGNKQIFPTVSFKSSMSTFNDIS